MKKIIAITVSVLIFVCFSSASAHADRKTMEGFLLGAGAVILGTAIINEIHSDDHHRTKVSVGYRTGNHRSHQDRYDNSHNYRHHNVYGYKHRHNQKYNHEKRGGHWEIERIWVGPVFKKKWIPGHYTHRGRWKDGRYERYMVKRGHWQEKKVWVRRHHH